MNLYSPKQLVDSIRTVRKNTILIAEDIHEDDYVFRPTLESRSVGQILTHILFVSRFDRTLHEGEERMSTLERFDFRKLLGESESEERNVHSKSELVNGLKESGDSFARWLEQLPEHVLAESVVQPGGKLKTRFEMILGTKEHEMHHRGQLTIIERMLGIVPHLTRRQRATEAELTKRTS